MRSDCSSSLRVLLSLAVCAACLAAVEPAHAQSSIVDEEYGAFGYPHYNKFSVLGLFGVQGDATLQGTKLKLDPTYGVALRYEHPINTFIALGGQMAVTTWVPGPSHDLGAGRSTLVDVSFVLKLRYPFSKRFELYVAAPIGGSFSFGNYDTFGGNAAFAPGLSATGLFGMHVGVTQTKGLVVEGGYSIHTFTHQVAPLQTANYSIDVFLSQPWFMLGFYMRT